MTRLLCAMVLTLIAFAATAPTAHGVSAGAVPARPEDPPDAASPRRADSDTLWFGGTDADGMAIPDGVWDFEDGTLQGWTDTDLSDILLYARWSTRVDFIGDPVDAVIDGLGSVWFGTHLGEAREMCWPGGQGYGNNWIQSAEKTFIYSGTSGIELSWRFFVDCETQFEYVHLELETSAGVDTIAGPYTGAVQEGTAIGSPTDPEVVTGLRIPDSVFTFDEPFTLRWIFISDPLISDALDSFGGFLDSVHGPFGFDDFVLRMDIGTTPLYDESDFETDADGWTFHSRPATGTYLDASPVGSLDPPIPAGCVLDDPANDHVMTLSDRSGAGPAHPNRQIQASTSPSAYVGPGSVAEGATGAFLRWESFEDTHRWAGAGYRAAVHYYPWTCPETGVVGWTIEPAGDGGYLLSDDPECYERVSPIGSTGEIFPVALPADAESLRVVFWMISDCDAFGVDESRCTGPDSTNATPYLDNIQLGVIVNVPETLGVPGDFASIGDAIASSADLDTIEVEAGTYTGPGNIPLDFDGKHIVVRSVSGPEVTILDAEGLSPVAVFDDGEGPGARLEGFTLVNGSAPGSVARGGETSGGGIFCDLSSPTIVDCVVRDNVAQLGGGGVYVANGDPVFRDCVITGNHAAVAGGMIVIDGSVSLEGCMVAGNSSILIGGIGASTDAVASLVECTVTGNHATDADQGVGGMRAAQSRFELTRCIVLDNCGPYVGDGWIESDSELDIVCSNVNPAGWILDGSFTIDSDSFFADPLFCEPEVCTAAPTSDGNYGVQEGSPCLPENSPCGQLIGALGSCTTVSASLPVVAPRLELFANVPNPFNPTTRISFSIPDRGAVRLRVFDVSGQVVRTLADGVHAAGQHQIAWDGRNEEGVSVASGIYFYQLQANGQTATRRMTLLK